MGLSADGLPRFSLLPSKLRKSEIKQQLKEFDLREDKVVQGIALYTKVLGGIL